MQKPFLKVATFFKFVLALFRTSYIAFCSLSPGVRFSFLGMFAAGVFTHVLVLKTSDSTPLNSTPDGKQERLLPVATDTVQRRTLKNMFTTHAYLQPWKEVTMRPNGNVSVREVKVNIGSKVGTGDILAYTGSESQALRAQLDKLDHQLHNMDFGVTMALAKKSFLSQNEFAQKDLEHKAAKIRERINRIETTGAITSPIDGVISDLNLKSGDFIDNPGQYYIKIADPSILKIQLYLPQNVAVKTATGAAAVLSRISSDDQGREVKVETSAQVRAVAPVVDPKTGSVYVEIAANQIPSGWLAGMYVQVGITVDHAENVNSVTSDSIVYEDEKPFVYRVVAPSSPDQGHGPATSASQDAPVVQKAEVTLGLKDSLHTEIRSGLDEADMIVIEGQGSLSDGAKVEVVR